MRLFFFVICLVFASPSGSVNAQIMGTGAITSGGFSANDPYLIVALRGSSRFSTRSMYLLSVNEHKERAGCLYGVIVNVLNFRVVYITQMVEMEALNADSTRFKPEEDCSYREDLLGRVHSHIVTLGDTRVLFSEIDDPQFEKSGYEFEMIVWGVDKDFIHLTVRTKLGQNIYRFERITNCCNKTRAGEP